MCQREAVGAKTLRSHRAWHGRARAQGERSGVSRASSDTTFSDVNGTAAERSRCVDRTLFTEVGQQMSQRCIRYVSGKPTGGCLGKRNKQGGGRTLLGAMDMFIILIVVVVSWVCTNCKRD